MPGIIKQATQALCHMNHKQWLLVLGAALTQLVGGAQVDSGASTLADATSCATDTMSEELKVTQSAFVFIKPHANTETVQQAVRGKFAEVGVTITGDGEITGEVIDDKKLIDQHYYAIASKATLLKPVELNVPTDKFKSEFGEDWETVLAENRAFNAIDCAEALGCSPKELDEKWVATKGNGRVKLGGGFYCALIDPEKKIYTFNAFFMAMRKRFTAPGSSIHYFTIEFNPAKLSWAEFRGKVLGPTDPATAPEDSLRGIIHADWKKLGLSAAPDTGNNGVRE